MNSDSEIYDGWEKYYQNSSDRDAWDSKPSSMIPMLMERFTVEELINFLDVGCGDGRNLWPWLERGNVNATALDISPTALLKIRRSCEEKGLICPILLKASIEHLPVEDNTFDAIQCLDTLPQVLNIEKAIQEMVRVLRPGGKFLFNVFTPLDCAYGQGKKIDVDTFVYNETLFRFFQEQEILSLLPKDLIVINKQNQFWDDPPHFPFRPYPHTHNAIWLTCQKNLKNKNYGKQPRTYEL